MRNILNVILMSLFVVIPVMAGPSYTTYQARIVKPDGYPLEDANVNFKFSVLTPTGNCILYSETFSSVNMLSSGGYVTFSLGSGTKDFPTDATTFKDILSNTTPTLNCAAGGLPFYIPQAQHTRKLVMQFNHAGKWQTIPAMNMNAIPYAMYADDANTLNGKTENEFVFKSAIPTCVGDQRLAFNGVSFSCSIANAASGTVSVTSVSQALGYTPVAPASLTTMTNVVTSLTSDVSTLNSGLGAVSSSVTTLNSQVSNLTSNVTSLTTNVSALTTNFSTLTQNISNVSSTLSLLNTEFSSVSATVTVLNSSVSELFQTTQVVSGATYSKVLVDGRGRVINGSNLTASDISIALGFSPVSSTVIDLGTSQVTGTLSTARLPSFSGDLNSVSGSAALVLNSVGPGISSGSSYSKVTVDGKGRVITGSSISAFDISTALGFSPVSSTVIDLGTSQVTGTLSAALLPAFSGDVNSVSGSTALVLSNSGVIAGLYNQVTVDSKGRVTSGTFAPIVSSQWVTSATSISYTNGRVGVGTTNPQSSLDVSGAIRVGVTAASCSSANEGAQRYNTTTKEMEFCNGTSWNSFGGSSNIPTGAILAFDLTSCPTGWTEYTAARGRFLRGIDNGAGNDPGGTRAPGNVQTDDFKSHTHTPNGYFVSGQSGADGDLDGSTTVTGYDKSTMTGSLSSTGGTETRPKNVAVLFCRKN